MKSALVRFEILGRFVNTLTADDKCSRRNMQNSPQQIQTALSSKQKTFFSNFYYISDSYIKFGRF